MITITTNEDENTLTVTTLDAKYVLAPIHATGVASIETHVLCNILMQGEIESTVNGTSYCPQGTGKLDIDILPANCNPRLVCMSINTDNIEDNEDAEDLFAAYHTRLRLISYEPITDAI